MNRLFVDLKENHEGLITGSIKLPKDSVFTLEALAEVVMLFSTSCKVPAAEILDDLKVLCL